MQIVVKWKSVKCDEFLDVDLDILDLNILEGFTPFTETEVRGRGRGPGAPTFWKVKSRIEEHGDGWQIIVKYEDDQEDEDVLQFLEWNDPQAQFGTNKIILKRDQNGKIKRSGTFEWIAKNEQQDRGCWKLNERDKTVHGRWQRDNLLRKRTLSKDKRCVITNVALEIVLDAAHIRSVREGGRDTIENALCLRTDIHRLFDAGKIRINPQDGKVVLDGSLSCKYRKLQDKELPKHTLDRARNALQWRWDNPVPMEET